jgi:RND superfamily putative drug exporter
MLASLGKFAVKYKYIVIVIWLAFFVFTRFLPGLGSVINSSSADFLPASAPSSKAFNLLSNISVINTSGPTDTLIAVSTSGPLTNSQIAAINNLEFLVSKISGIKKVVPRSISRDMLADSATVEYYNAAQGDPASLAPQVKSIRNDFRKFSNYNLNFYLTGSVADAVDSQSSSNHTQGLIDQLSILFILVLLFFIFRAVLSPFLILLPAVLSLLIAQPLIAEASKTGFQVSFLVEILLIVIMLGAGTDYGLFLIFRVREEIKKKKPLTEAITFSIERVGHSIFFSALTVIAALLCLLLSSFGVYRGLGPSLAIGVGIVFLANVTLLPALVAVFKNATFWPTRPKPGDTSRGLWGRIAAKIINRPLLTLLGGAIIFFVLCISLVSFHVTGFNETGSTNSNSNSAQGSSELSSHYNQKNANPIFAVFKINGTIWTKAYDINIVTQVLNSNPNVSFVQGPLDPLGYSITDKQFENMFSASGLNSIKSNVLEAQQRQAVLQFISKSGSVFYEDIYLKYSNPSSTSAIYSIPSLRITLLKAARAIGAQDSGLAGETPSLYDVATLSTSDIFKIMPVVFLFLAIVLFLLLRSLIAPIYLVVSVAVSFLSSLGFSVLAFQIIGGQSGINFVLPFLLFIFIMALGEDYNILVISRIREEAHNHSLKEAIITAIGATGTTITSAGLILAGTFGVLTIAGGSQTQQIGLGLAFGIILDTFVVRTLIIPSIVMLLGKYNWWPSKLYDFHHELESKVKAEVSA